MTVQGIWCGPYLEAAPTLILEEKGSRGWLTGGLWASSKDGLEPRDVVGRRFSDDSGTRVRPTPNAGVSSASSGGSGPCSVGDIIVTDSDFDLCARRLVERSQLAFSSNINHATNPSTTSVHTRFWQDSAKTGWRPHARANLCGSGI